MIARGLVSGVGGLLLALALAGIGGCASPAPSRGDGALRTGIVAFSPHGDVLATAGDGRSGIALRDGRTLAARTELPGTPAIPGAQSEVRSLGFSQDGTRLLAAGVDDTVVVWDVATGRELCRRADLQGARQGALSPDGTLVAVAGPGHAASVWRIADGQRIAELKGHFDDVTAIAFSHHGDVIATGSADRTVRLWPLARPEPVTLPEWHRQTVAALAFSPDDLLLASLAGDLKLWRVPDRRPIAHPLDARAVATVSPNVQALVTLLMIVASARSIQLGGGPLGAPPVGVDYAGGPVPSVLQVAFSPDGKLLAVLRRATPSLGNGEILIAEIAGSRVTKIDCQCAAMAFRPDDGALLSAGEQIRLWNAETGESLLKVP